MFHQIPRIGLILSIPQQKSHNVPPTSLHCIVISIFSHTLEELFAYLSLLQNRIKIIRDLHFSRQICSCLLHTDKTQSQVHFHRRMIRLRRIKAYKSSTPASTRRSVTAQNVWSR